MQKISDWWRYWRENIKTAKGGFDMTVLIMAIILAVIAGAGGLLNYIGGSPTPTVSTHISAWCGTSAAILFAFWGLLWLPFRRHEQQESKHAQKLQSERDAHEKDKAELIQRVRTLQEQFNDQSERRVNKSILGLFLDKLEERTRLLERMSQSDFRDSLKNGEDEETWALVHRIKDFITKNIGQGEAAAFTSLAGIDMTPIPSSTWSVSAFLEDLENARRKQISMIDHLNHWSKQLKEIIKEYK